MKYYELYSYEQKIIFASINAVLGSKATEILKIIIFWTIDFLASIAPVLLQLSVLYILTLFLFCVYIEHRIWLNVVQYE